MSYNFFSSGSSDRKRKMGGGGLGDLDSDDETMGTYQGSMSTVKGVSGGPEDGEDKSQIICALF